MPTPRGVGWKVGVIENRKVEKGDFRRISGGVAKRLEMTRGFLDRGGAETYNRGGGEGASHEVRRHP